MPTLTKDKDGVTVDADTGWLVPVTAADGDAWRRRERTFEALNRDVVCECGHPATPNGGLNSAYHEVNQGARCRGIGCECLTYRPKLCAKAPCPEFAREPGGAQLCKEHLLEELRERGPGLPPLPRRGR